MIIRQAVECDICGEPHTIRVGLGHGSSQEHSFSCRGCDQEIGFAMSLDQENGRAEFSRWDNCRPTEEVSGSQIVNLDADFLVPPDQQGVDFAFPRMTQFHELVMAREAQGLSNAAFTYGSSSNFRPNRRADYADEWLELRRAWLLQRGGKAALARPRIKDGSDKYYGDEPLANLEDWIFRLCLHVGGVPTRNMLSDAISEIKSIKDDRRFEELMSHYDKEMAHKRGRIYLDVMNGFFGAYTDFSQILQRIASGLSVPVDMEVSSSQFDRTRMFYGNAFEALGTLVDLIAYINNILQGRKWDTFERLTVKSYLELDKSSRFGPFATTPAFAKLNAESDNQLRNASHHGSLEIDPLTRTIRYRAGKGGQGEENYLTYTDYLVKSLSIYQQILTLFCIEILLTKGRTKSPI